jgi:hypothetical protein
MGLATNIRSDSLPRSLCADTDTGEGSHPNTPRCVAIPPNTHCYLDVHLNAHRYVATYLTATLANTHGNAYRAASSPTRNTYTCPPGLV